MPVNLLVKVVMEIRLKRTYKSALETQRIEATIIKVKNSPRIAESKFFSKNPSSISGGINKMDGVKKLKYLGLTGHFLFNKIKFKIVESP